MLADSLLSIRCGQSTQSSSSSSTQQQQQSEQQQQVEVTTRAQIGMRRIDELLKIAVKVINRSMTE